MNHAENFANFMKTWILTYCAPFQGKKQPENMDPRVHDLHTHGRSSDIPVKQVSWTYSKNFWENGQTQTPCKLLTLHRPENTYSQLFRIWNMITPIIPICCCGFSICIAGETVKRSTYCHWNRPWTVSQSKYTQHQFEFWTIWGPKMAHKFYPLGPSFYTLTIVAPLNF